MAKQKGIIKLEGSIGDITFFKTADGYLAREKAPISAAQIANDPAFQRTRENMAEFGRAGKASKLLRNALRQVLQYSKDAKVTGRLTGEFNRVIKADLTNPRGQRNVIDGEAELLMGFNFNSNAPLSACIYAPFTASIDRPAGTLTVDIPSFTPSQLIVAPSGSTHIKLMAMGASVDFENESSEANLQETAILPWDTTPVAASSLVCTVSPASTHPLFLVLGIQFFQLVNGIHYPLKDGGFNALQMVKVSGL
jgi:hypothetical protein